MQELNRFLRGWGGYFRYGNSAGMFDAISQYALERLAGFVAKRHKRSRQWGMRLGNLRVTGQFRADHLVWDRHCPQALPVLAGTGRTPTVKNVGEPCAGEPHARFDGEGWKPSLRPPRQPLTLALGEAS